VQVKDGVFPKNVGEFDGYVITGSPASANGDAPWIIDLLAFIREIDAAKIPTVGVCFGHQVIARALGGTVSKNAGGWGFGVAATHYSHQENWMVPKQNSLALYAAHSEQVTELPKEAVVLGGSDFCPVGSFKVGDHIFTTEYHPEMTQDFISELSFEMKNYVGPELLSKARAQITKPAEGKVFAKWMVNFLEMARPA
jgi:GMP synthase-like glutamine amidotransferase